MQTFVPYDNVAKSMQVLDRQRLGKQRVETLQILNALSGRSKGWVNHPATKMWRGHERALVEYGVACCDEWIGRGYKDTCREKIMAFREVFPNTNGMPEWWGDAEVHDSHKSRLLQKDPVYYGQFGWDVPVMEYVWR